MGNPQIHTVYFNPVFFFYFKTISQKKPIVRFKYQIENKYRKDVNGYGFLSFARKFGNKYGKKLMDSAISTKYLYGKKIMDTAKKEGVKFAKTSGRKILDKSAIVTGDLIGDKIVNKINSLGNKEPKNEQEQEEIIISPEKRQQIIDDLRLF